MTQEYIEMLKERARLQGEWLDFVHNQDDTEGGLLFYGGEMARVQHINRPGQGTDAIRETIRICTGDSIQTGKR